MQVAIHCFTKIPSLLACELLVVKACESYKKKRTSHIPDAINHGQDVANHNFRTGSPGTSQSFRELSIINHPVTLAQLCFHHPSSLQLVPQHCSLSAHPGTGELPGHNNPPLELPLPPLQSQRLESPDSHPAHRGTRTATASGHYPHHPRFLAAATGRCALFAESSMAGTVPG